EAVRPGQQVAKLVHDEIARMLGAEVGPDGRVVGPQGAAPLQFNSVGPTLLLRVGLQGPGKRTTAAKLARRLKREQKAPCLVAADVYRPAAREQLEQLGGQVGVPVFPGKGEEGRGGGVVELVWQAVREAEQARCRAVIVDTAGRVQIGVEMMDELRALRGAVDPREVLLVADGMSGQDAVRIAQGFHAAVRLTGVILTKLDGDARGGAALSIHGATGVPIKYVGVGEKLDALEPFDPGRMAGRILGQGDVVGLVEKAATAIDGAATQRLERKARSKRGMDLSDFLIALKQMEAMGPLKHVLSLLPGVNAKALQAVRADDKRLKHVEAIVLSMTPEERAEPTILTGSRRRRGSTRARSRRTRCARSSRRPECLGNGPPSRAAAQAARAAGGGVDLPAGGESRRGVRAADAAVRGERGAAGRRGTADRGAAARLPPRVAARVRGGHVAGGRGAMAGPLRRG